MHAAREFPPNPHALVIHVDALLTEQIVETYLPASSAAHSDWVRQVLEIPGVRVLSVNAHRIRLQKHKTANWTPLQSRFEEVLHRRLGVIKLRDLVENESRRRRFAWHGEAFGRSVYEGKLQAQAHPVAATLFAIHGVTGVILDGNEIEILKCPLCAWAEMAPAIELELESRVC